MKIVFIIGQMSGGGAERVISVLANWFCIKGYDTSVICVIKDELTYEIDSKIKYYANTYKETKKLKRVTNRYKFLRNKLKDIKPDVIISFTTQINIYALIANLGLKSKIIISERNDPYRDPSSKITRIIRNLIYYLSDRYVFQTKEAKQYFGESIQNRSSIIPNPLKKDLPSCYNGERKKEFVTVARLSKQKNLTMLIDAFEKFYLEDNNYKLKIYGEGPLRKYLENYVSEKNLSNVIYFMGFEKDVHSKIFDSSAFILTSDYEGISNAMLEALAIGIPTICTDCPIGGARMFIKHKINGLLIPTGDVNNLYEKMKEIVYDDKLSQIISNNAVKIRDKLSVDNICISWESEISKL